MARCKIRAGLLWFHSLSVFTKPTSAGAPAAASRVQVTLVLPGGIAGQWTAVTAIFAKLVVSPSASRSFSGRGGGVAALSFASRQLSRMDDEKGNRSKVPSHVAVPFVPVNANENGPVIRTALVSYARSLSSWATADFPLSR